MTKIKYEKPVAETTLRFEPCGQVDLAHFYHEILPNLDTDKHVKMYRRDLEAVMKDKKE